MSADAETTPPVPERDPFEPRFARGASGLLREFNLAGILDAADVHVARLLGRLGGETDEAVLLAVALAVRGPRLGHVHVDLAHIQATAAVDAEDPVDLDTLRWPDPAGWTAAVAASPLLAGAASAPSDGIPGELGRSGPLHLTGSWLYLDRYWAEEVDVAGSLRALAAAPAAAVDEDRLAGGVARLFGPDAGERPAQAAMTAVRRRFAVVAGGPGTGKTTTVAKIVALLCEQAGDGRPPLIALAAPTGKAAARLEEAVRGQAAELDIADAVRAQLSSLTASTIHRLLGWRPGSSSRFRHDRNQRLPHDVVIVDETSMVSLSLMARLVEALRSGARLILVGDPGQLASIEAGAVLGDIVGPAGDAGPPAGAPIVVLDRVHRFGGAIAELARRIRAGDEDAVIELLRAGGDEVIWRDVDVAEHETPAAVAGPALAAALATLSAARSGDARSALDALGAFRILCAHRRGPYGVASWTTRLEQWLAGEVADLSPEDRWYAGRPLLVNENDYELRLNNGDTGVVVATGDADGGVTAAFARGGEIATYSPSRLGAIDTVYAMTVHKSQGSQFNAVALILPEPTSRILTRELFYTAATRAQQQLIIAGTEATVRAAVGRPVARASGLGRRLWGDLA